MSAASKVSTVNELLGLILENLPARNLLRVRLANRQCQAVVEEGAANGVGDQFFLYSTGDPIANHLTANQNAKPVRLNTLFFIRTTPASRKFYLKRDPLTAPGQVFDRMFLTQRPVQTACVRCVFITRDRGAEGTDEDERVLRWVDIKETSGITYQALADQMVAGVRAYEERCEKVVLRLQFRSTFMKLYGVIITN